VDEQTASSPADRSREPSAPPGRQLGGGGLAVPPGLASVIYPGPDGGVVERLIDDGEIVAFGAAGECGVRFGHAPVRDRAVPGIAGRLLTIGTRLIVECAERPGYRALELLVPGEATRYVPLGEAWSPRPREFTVVVAGGNASGWRMDVTVRRRAVPRGVCSVPTGLEPLQLAPADLELLTAYAAPLRRGHLEPATHRQVAAALHMDYNTARAKLYQIGRRFFAAELPMPDVSDKRIAVVECARLHGLLPGGGWPLVAEGGAG
jgi:hypothetical protein